jgi:hypothetical protein
MMTQHELIERNYRWNLSELLKPGALDPHYTGTPEELAREYAEADAGEGVIRPNAQDT